MRLYIILFVETHVMCLFFYALNKKTTRTARK